MYSHLEIILIQYLTKSTKFETSEIYRILWNKEEPTRPKQETRTSRSRFLGMNDNAIIIPSNSINFTRACIGIITFYTVIFYDVTYSSFTIYSFMIYNRTISFYCTRCAAPAYPAGARSVYGMPVRWFHLYYFFSFVLLEQGGTDFILDWVLVDIIVLGELCYAYSLYLNSKCPLGTNIWYFNCLHLCVVKLYYLIK